MKIQCGYRFRKLLMCSSKSVPVASLISSKILKIEIYTKENLIFALCWILER